MRRAGVKAAASYAAVAAQIKAEQAEQAWGAGGTASRIRSASLASPSSPLSPQKGAGGRRPQKRDSKKELWAGHFDEGGEYSRDRDFWKSTKIQQQHGTEVADSIAEKVFGLTIDKGSLPSPDAEDEEEDEEDEDGEDEERNADVASEGGSGSSGGSGGSGSASGSSDSLGSALAKELGKLTTKDGGKGETKETTETKTAKTMKKSEKKKKKQKKRMKADSEREMRRQEALERARVERNRERGHFGTDLYIVLRFLSEDLRPAVEGVSVAHGGQLFLRSAQRRGMGGGSSGSFGSSSSSSSPSGASGASGSNGGSTFDGRSLWALDPLVIEDPLNLGNNVGRSCFLFGDVQRAFGKALGRLGTATVRYARRGVVAARAARKHGGAGEGGEGGDGGEGGERSRGGSRGGKLGGEEKSGEEKHPSILSQVFSKHQNS